MSSQTQNIRTLLHRGCFQVPASALGLVRIAEHRCHDAFRSQGVQRRHGHGRGSKKGDPAHDQSSARCLLYLRWRIWRFTGPK